MTLFQILARKLGEGKIKATRKLLNRLRRETHWHHHSKPRRGKNRHSCRCLCAALAAATTLSLCDQAAAHVFG